MSRRLRAPLAFPTSVTPVYAIFLRETSLHESIVSLSPLMKGMLFLLLIRITVEM